MEGFPLIGKDRLYKRRKKCKQNFTFVENGCTFFLLLEGIQLSNGNAAPAVGLPEIRQGNGVCVQMKKALGRGRGGEMLYIDLLLKSPEEHMAYWQKRIAVEYCMIVIPTILAAIVVPIVLIYQTVIR